MKNNLQTSIVTGSKLSGSLSAGERSLKAVISQEAKSMGATIGSMNLYNYYTKEEIDGMFGEIVTLKKQSFLEFPNVGNKSTLYADTTTGSTYIWDEDDMSYVCIGKDYEKISQINGGSANE